MPRIRDLKGRRSGRLEVLELSHIGNGYRAMWKCRCDCGNECVVPGAAITTGKAMSCGCYRTERIVAAVSTHHLSHTKIYGVWRSMKGRCLTVTHQAYKYYGARGIGVCPEWCENFQAFYDYVSQLPHFGEPGYSFDRIDNDGNYEPGNVRWATLSEQNKNKRYGRRK